MTLFHTTTTVALLLSALAACADDDTHQPPPAASVDGWEIEVAAPEVSGATVTASFTVRGTGIRGFGTCMVADLHAGKACTEAADCATGSAITPATGHFEYCFAAGGSATKTCWTRNGEDAAWCDKVPPPGRAEGTFMTPAVDAMQLSGSTRWAAVACLNAGTYPAFTDGPRPPCASADPTAAEYRAYYWSEPTVHHRP